MDACFSRMATDYTKLSLPGLASASVSVERRRLLDSGSYAPDLDHQLLLTKQTELIAALYDRKMPAGIVGQTTMVAKFALMPWRILQALNYWSRVVHYSREFLQDAFVQRPNCSCSDTPTGQEFG